MKLFIFEYTDYDEDDFSIPYHLVSLIQEKLKNKFFPESGLDLLKPEHELYLTLAVRDELLANGPKYGTKQYKWFLAVPYEQLVAASNLNKTYTDLFFEAFTKVATHYKLDLDILNNTKESVLKELETRPKEYEITEQEIENLNWVREIRVKYGSVS